LSIRHQLCALKDIFSRINRPNSTKLGRRHAWGWGFRYGSNKGAGPMWGKIRKILMNLQKCSSYEPLAGMH